MRASQSVENGAKAGCRKLDTPRLKFYQINKQSDEMVWPPSLCVVSLIAQ